MLPRKARAAGRSARIPARPLRASAAAVLGAAALLALAGCGGDDPAETPPPAAAPGEAALTVTLHPEGRGGPERSADVTCPPEAPNEEDDCEAIAELEPGDADPVPPGVACTQIYGGPDIVELEGTLHGVEIDTELTRADGCEIDRFERFEPLLDALFPNYRPGQALTP